jgi:rod shape-determining protein MreD
VGISAAICILMLPTRWPGMELLGVGPSWLVMWLVAWSLNRSIWHGVIAAFILGLIQDGMTIGHTSILSFSISHVVSLVVVALAIDRLKKRRYVTNNIIGATILAFTMTILSEIVLCFQHLLDLTNLQFPIGVAIDIETFWQDRSRVMAISAIVSSIWMPILYYPLQLCWKGTSDR